MKRFLAAILAVMCLVGLTNMTPASAAPGPDHTMVYLDPTGSPGKWYEVGGDSRVTFKTQYDITWGNPSRVKLYVKRTSDNRYYNDDGKFETPYHEFVTNTFTGAPLTDGFAYLGSTHISGNIYQMTWTWTPVNEYIGNGSNYAIRANVRDNDNEWSGWYGGTYLRCIQGSSGCP